MAGKSKKKREKVKKRDKARDDPLVNPSAVKGTPMGRCDRRRGPPTADDEEKSAGPERGHRGIRSAAASARARVSIIVIAFELIIRRRRRRRYRRYPSRVAPVGAVSSISRWSRP